MSSSNSDLNDESALTKTKPDLLLAVFIHGFKGNDNTFKEFPQRLQHVLSESINNAHVESIIFPAYEANKGRIGEYASSNSDWLTTLTVQRENDHGGGAGSAKIVLCGHSMGGFLAADSLLEFIKTRPDQDCPLWPRIIACVTFDTPFLGINPGVVKNGVTKAAEYANAATTAGSAIFGSFAGLGAQKAASSASTSVPASPWSKWAPAAFAVGGALLAGAAAGGAYYKRNDINQGFSWVMDHMKYAGNVWDEQGLRRRVDDLVDAQEKHGVIFRNFYVLLPEAPPVHLAPRSFIVQPKRTSREVKYFTPMKNKRAIDEVEGHTGMFDARTNDGYYNLGLVAANAIREAVQVARSTVTAKLDETSNDV
ncbi:hypothetical protein NP233_g612 [Leucocoprinus birnbaumii]|uniref:DUF676 domain-containing protein n=1 Tax=Leucocoprinus birnbaumii TaxID=56174 RepID=A0AAD5YVN1_9AGAR|nr:hypothetical protein NP233_g612 [Leucocoprinus birnbaumii]